MNHDDMKQHKKYFIQRWKTGNGKSGQNLGGWEGIGSGKMYCEACGAHFWVDPDVELAASDYVCPYCGEGIDVVRSKLKEGKK